MDKNEQQFNPIQEQLRIMQQCPVCKGKFAPPAAKVLEKRGEAHLIHITCPHCHNALLAMIVVSQLGMSSVGMVTDLNVFDAQKLQGKQALSEDELLDFHVLLKNNQILN